jgi:hypothetical protein
VVETQEWADRTGNGDVLIEFVRFASAHRGGGKQR